MTISLTLAANPSPPGAVSGTGALVRATSPTLVTPNIGVATGTSLQTTGPIAQMKQTGAATKASSVGENYPFAPGASKSFTVQLGNINGGFAFFVSRSSDGAGAVFYGDYATAALTKLAGHADFVDAWTATANQVAVTKGANSTNPTIITGSSFTSSISVVVIGAQVTGTTEPV